MQPESAQAAESLSNAKRQIGGMARRVAEDEARARRLEDKIYKLNHPPGAPTRWCEKCREIPD